MTRKLADWDSEHGQITNIRPSDASGRNTAPTAVKFGYNNHGIEGYLGNVGSMRAGRHCAPCGGPPTTEADMQKSKITSFPVVLVVLGIFALGGCEAVVGATAQKAFEDRTTEDQATDAKITAVILKKLSDKDKGLLLDLSVDVWEQRLLLTGTLDNAAMKRDVEKLATDERLKNSYMHIKLVSTSEKEQLRQQSKNKDVAEKSGIGQSVNDFWIQLKIKGQLLVERGVTSVNYFWRSVLNDVYIIGRARSTAERKKVLDIIRATEGVKSVRQYIEIKPLKG